jgi:hypothetical protein
MLPFCQQHEVWLVGVDALNVHNQEVLLVLNGDVHFQHIPSHAVREHTKPARRLGASSSSAAIDDAMDVDDIPGSVMLGSREVACDDDDDDLMEEDVAPQRKVLRFECLADVTVFLKGALTHWQHYWKVAETKKVRVANKYREIDYLVPLKTIWGQLIQIAAGNPALLPKQVEWLAGLRALPTLNVSRVDLVENGVCRNICEGILRFNKEPEAREPSSAPPSSSSSSSYKSLQPYQSKIVLLHRLPLKNWTSLTLATFFDRPNRDFTIEPALTKISHYQRYGPGRNFQFLCHWQNGVQTWQKYIHLIGNPAYREFFKRNQWDIDVECNYDLAMHVDDDALSDDAREDEREHEAYYDKLEQEDHADSDEERELFGYKPKQAKRKKPAKAAKKAGIHKINTGYPIRVFRCSKSRSRKGLVEDDDGY